MGDLYARTVFFVKDAERSLAFYTEQLGFNLEWNYRENDRAYVFEVSLFGFQLILNQTEPEDDRAGHGRAFIGLDDGQVETFNRYLKEKRVKSTAVTWGAPTLAIYDPDGNEIFVWFPEKDREAVTLAVATES